LTMRGISPGDYRAKWGLPADYPLVSAAYSARRSEISRAIGRGRMRASVRLEAAE
jgi:predicted transcriptional regulator